MRIIFINLDLEAIVLIILIKIAIIIKSLIVRFNFLRLYIFNSKRYFTHSYKKDFILLILE